MSKAISAALALIVAGVLDVSAASADPRLITVHDFQGASDGSYPSGVLLTLDGALFGTTARGGSGPCHGGCGTVFELTAPALGTDPWNLNLLWQFQGGSDSRRPSAALVTSHGDGYGFAEGQSGDWMLVRMVPTGPSQTQWTKETVLLASPDMAPPQTGLVADPLGVLYGAAYGTRREDDDDDDDVASVGTVFALTPPQVGSSTWQQTVLTTPGAGPARYNGGLVLGSDGTLFGTSRSGAGPLASASTGEFHDCRAHAVPTCGTVFKLTPPAAGQTRWTTTVLWTFDGAAPSGGMAMDWTGALYGTTARGGAHGHGTVFKLTPPAAGQSDWVLTTLWSFGAADDGRSPNGFLTQVNGALLGTTYAGGTSDKGTVYLLNPPAAGQTDWTETVLWSFSGGDDGSRPDPHVVFDASSGIYGTTNFGGSQSCEQGCGTVFKLLP